MSWKKMNHRQRKLLIWVLWILYLMILFPPFCVHSPVAVIDRGYGFIFFPPEPPVAINVSQLFLQFVLVGGIGFIGWLLLSKGRGDEKTKADSP